MPDPSEPVICFGQQPCGFFPRRFLWAKILTARRLQREIGGRIVFFFHDSDHDPRETQTVLHEKQSGAEVRLNFAFANKLQKKYTPLYAKRIVDGWQEKTARQLPQFVEKPLADLFAGVEAGNVADFCLEYYRALGLLEGVEVVRSSDREVRESACAVDEFFVDVAYEGEIVRAHHETDGRLRLHRGGNAWIDLPDQNFERAQISPTRDSRLGWMQSVVKCTHYVAGAGEMGYLNCAETPEIEFVCRESIERSSDAYIEFSL